MSAHTPNKFTPGPWMVKEQQGEIQIWEDRTEGRVRHTSCVAVANGRPCDLAKADACLIAAAPDLLDALKLAIRQNSCDMLMTGEELRKCEAAIAKATGEAA